MQADLTLFSLPQSKVLGWLFGQPERWYHIQELIRLTSLASASLQREIKRLHSGGLVVEERIGNLRRVKANPNSPIFEELSSLVRKTLGIVPTVSHALASLQADIELAFVFGSMAKGAAHAGSDVDVLVVSGTLQLHDVLGVLLPVEAQLSRRIEVKLYTVKEFEQRRKDPQSLVSKILAEPIEIVLGSMP
jgi:predicted nucleotidyltransferase